MADLSATAVVFGGVDCHARAHHAAALDDRGRRLSECAFPATRAGYAELLGWLRRFGAVEVVGVESTGAYGAGLTRALTRAGVRVVEVNQPHPHTRHRRGKSDAVDAEAAARKVLSGEATAVPKDTTGAVEAIRLLRSARASAVKARAAAVTQLGELLVTAPAALRERVPGKTLRGRAAYCARFRPDLGGLADPLHAAKLALRCLAERVHALDLEIAALDRHLAALVAATAPRTLALLGVGPGHAGQLLVSAGQNVQRMRSEAAFAHLCGAAPIPASSGQTVRHRLNPGGDRAANSTLHMIAVVRLRYCERTRAYAARRAAEGRSKREILRCLKRYIAREVYHALRADLAPAARPDPQERRVARQPSSPTTPAGERVTAAAAAASAASEGPPTGG
jgi:transposase